MTFLVAKLPEAYAPFDPIVDVFTYYPSAFYPISLCLASIREFSIKKLYLNFKLSKK